MDAQVHNIAGKLCEGRKKKKLKIQLFIQNIQTIYEFINVKSPVLSHWPKKN